jgi:hypothetical protein
MARTVATHRSIRLSGAELTESKGQVAILGTAKDGKTDALYRFPVGAGTEINPADIAGNTVNIRMEVKSRLVVGVEVCSTVFGDPAQNGDDEDEGEDAAK